jgi:hypothetical protein
MIVFILEALKKAAPLLTKTKTWLKLSSTIGHLPSLAPKRKVETLGADSGHDAGGRSWLETKLATIRN